MELKNAYKGMLDNTVSPIACVSMNHQNQLEQMTMGSCSLQTLRKITVRLAYGKMLLICVANH
jgi:hypothetical protein